MPDPNGLFGVASLSAAFGDGMQTLTPWRRAPRSKRVPLFDADAVGRILRGPVHLEELDPRDLEGSQPWVVRHHVRYYLDDEWERTGRTAADMHVVSNRFPLIWIAATGAPVILAGHHRSMAALLHGRPLLARVVRATGRPAPSLGSGDAITPRLWITPTDHHTATHPSMIDPVAVADQIVAGSTITVDNQRSAEHVLELLGLTADERRDRLIVARRWPAI